MGLQTSHDSFRAPCSATSTMDGALIRAHCKADDLRAVKEAIGHRPSLLSDRVDRYGGTLLHEACRYVLFLTLVKRKAALFFGAG